MIQQKLYRSNKGEFLITVSRHKTCDRNPMISFSPSLDYWIFQLRSPDLSQILILLLIILEVRFYYLRQRRPLRPASRLERSSDYMPKDNPDNKIILATFHSNFTLILLVYKKYHTKFYSFFTMTQKYDLFFEIRNVFYCDVLFVEEKRVFNGEVLNK